LKTTTAATLSPYYHHEDSSLLKQAQAHFFFSTMYDHFPLDRGTSSSWSPVALSFLAGVSSASIIWYTLGKIHRESALSEEKELLASFRQWWLRDIQSRIGELPSLPRRTRWPWDRKNRSGSNHPSTPDGKNGTTSSNSTQQGSTSTSNNDSTTSSAASPSPVDEKSGLCIGSIFGLDVGGTLAKLVYFEQKAETMNHDRGAGHRERNYRFSASARAVFMARRGAGGDEEDSSSGAASPRARNSTGDGPGQAVWTPSRIRRRSLDTATSPRPLHSDDSDKDLETLNMIRNESLPDDLHAYAEAVGASNVRTYGAGNVDDGSGTIFREKSESVNDENEHVGIDEDADIRKSRSMLDFSKSRDHAEALDRFYNLARRLDSYREGVKDHELSFYSRELGGEFHFIRFETRRMQNAMDLIRANNLHLNICEMGATGGGAHKFAAKWEQDLGIQMKKQDELDSLVAGMQFVLSTVVGECYTFRPHDAASARSSSAGSSNSSADGSSSDSNVGVPNMDEEDDDTETTKAAPEDRGKVDEWWWSRKVQRDAISYSSTYPYLLVTIGTGVSILRVDGPRKHERISGSTIGGGTYWGLIRLLTDLEDFEDVMKLAERGDPSKVDMMVGDIYGENSDALEKIGLTSNLVRGRRAGSRMR
jgi:pantothenate kinase